jgi:hypothetical protein
LKRALIIGQVGEEDPDFFALLMAAARYKMKSVPAATRCLDLDGKLLNIGGCGCAPIGLDGGLDKLAAAMKRSDFVLVVQSTNAPDYMLAMRVGMARALGIPIALARRIIVRDRTIEAVADHVFKWATIDDLRRGFDMVTELSTFRDALERREREVIEAF